MFRNDPSAAGSCLPPSARGAAALVLCLLAVGASPARSQDMTGHEHHRMAMASGSLPSPARVMDVQPVITDLPLVDASGRAVALGAVLDTPDAVLVNFIFTSCTTICPVMSAGFAQLDARLAAEGRRARLVSISIDPDVDTPARLREYAASHGARPDWVFLTGTPASVEAAQRAFGAFRGAKEGHAAATFVRRGPDRPWERIDGLASEDMLYRALAGTATTGHD